MTPWELKALFVGIMIVIVGCIALLIIRWQTRQKIPPRAYQREFPIAGHVEPPGPGYRELEHAPVELFAPGFKNYVDPRPAPAFQWPERSFTPPRRPFDHDRDRWSW